MDKEYSMSGWSTFFFVVAVLLIIVSVVALALASVAAFISLLFSALLFLASSKLCKCVDKVLNNQKKIIIMLDNLTE